MTIELNGQPYETAATTVEELARELGLPAAGIAVARNGQVVRRTDHAAARLEEADTIELVRAVQGG